MDQKFNKNSLLRIRMCQKFLNKIHKWNFQKTGFLDRFQDYHGYQYERNHGQLYKSKLVKPYKTKEIAYNK